MSDVLISLKDQPFSEFLQSFVALSGASSSFAAYTKAGIACVESLELDKTKWHDIELAHSISSGMSKDFDQTMLNVSL